MITLPLNITTYALLSSYCLSGGIMEHAAVFRGWLHVHEPRQLKALQSASGKGALYTYVLPKTALTIFNAYLALTYSSTPNTTTILGHVGGGGENPNLRSGLWFGLAMLAVSWTSSFLVQVPLQLRIRETGDLVLVRRLYRTTWTRTVAIVLHFCSVVWILGGCEFY